MPQVIFSSGDAISAAEKECTLPIKEGMDCRYSITEVYYDETADIWKVVFRFSQNDGFQAIYLNSQGITQMIVTK